jgi:DNA-binding HxlR family transcriptional regulator
MKTRKISKVILQVLQETPNHMLRFMEIKKRAEEIWGAEIANQLLIKNLDVLMRQQLVEKVLHDGHLKYRLTEKLFKKQTILTLQGLLNSAEEFQFLLGFREELPFVAFVQSPSSLLNQPSVDFSSPADVFAKKMMETLQTYLKEWQEVVKKLLFWAYWAGVQSKIFNVSWLEAVEKAENFAKENKEKLERLLDETKSEDVRCRVEAEDALLKILAIVKELIGKPNLQEFLSYLFSKKAEVERLKDEIFMLSGRSVLGGGETVFDGFLNFHELILSGLEAAGLSLPNEKTYLNSYGEVWNSFFRLLLESTQNLTGIRGGVKEAARMVKIYFENGLRALYELPYQSKTMLIYLWGYPEAITLADSSFLPSFDEWMKALKDGRLDHRGYLFSPEVEKKLINAFKNVKMGKSPRDEPIDFEMWTLADLYRIHPRGKDPEFYKEILDAIRERKKVRVLE